jgi:hypothetical protein
LTAATTLWCTPVIGVESYNTRKARRRLGPRQMTKKVLKAALTEETSAAGKSKTSVSSSGFGAKMST